MIRTDDTCFKEGLDSPEIRGIILAIEDDGMCCGVVIYIGMETERVSRKIP